MPTPSEDTPLPSPPPENLSTRSSFAGCPPEEDRTLRAPWDVRTESAPANAAGTGQMTHAHAPEQQPSPEPDSQSEPTDVVAAPELQEKSENLEDSGMVIDSASPDGSTDGPSESEARLAQSMSTAAITPVSEQPHYLYFPQQRHRLLCNATSSFLRPGSKFRGTQTSDRQKYDVQVEIKDVDMVESFLCGYLRIQGLTDDHPTLTTFFEGEIIGPKYLFKTTHPAWGSSEKVDLQHWARFPAWRPLAKSAKSPNFTLKNYAQREHLFMRWKEYFLVPDHRVKTITGASFEGFYYICFNQCTGSVSGIYFHAKSEKYQQLELQHVDDKGCMGAMEFR